AASTWPPFISGRGAAGGTRHEPATDPRPAGAAEPGRLGAAGPVVREPAPGHAAAGGGTLPPLLLPHAFRHMGLVFLLPTVVRGALPPAFARPAAYGDLGAGLLGGRDARPPQPLEHRGAADLALQRGGARRSGQRLLTGPLAQRVPRGRLLHPEPGGPRPRGHARDDRTDPPRASGLPRAFARSVTHVKQSRAMTRRARAILATACGAHFVHDGFSDILYVLLPVWATEFGLSFAQVGLLKTLYTGGMASFQVPAGLLAERRGEARLLAAGTAVTALGFLAAGLTGGFLALLACLALGGLGSGCQHPLSSSLVSRAYETGPRRTALGTYNFSGDLGKVAVPAAVALALPWLGWRGAVEAYAVVGLLAAAAILVLLGRLGAGRPEPARATGATSTAASGWGIRDPRAYSALSAIH